MNEKTDKTSGNAEGRGASSRKMFWFALVTILLGSVLGIAIVEIALLLFNPQVSLFPRWKHSREYGLVLPKDTKMIHQRPGKWKFVYTINGQGFRGEPVPISSRYERTNIVVLGDSYSMGVGSNDGEEYPSVMHERLGGGFDVVNLSVGGWGLTQQTRIFYEFGRLYDPGIVILQHCVNDPYDNLLDRVAEADSGRITFRETDRRVGRLQLLLSNSRLIQNSQIYSFLRGRYETWRSGRQASAGGAQESGGLPAAESPEERYYNELLEAFAVDLEARGVRLLMISVNGQLDHHPYIRSKVNELESRGLLTYLEVVDWLEGQTGYGSPEGHQWGAKAHRVIGDSLAVYISREQRPTQP